MNNGSELYGYIFWFNHYEEIWYAIDRNTQVLFFSGGEDRVKSKYYKTKDITVLIELICKPNKLKELNEN